MQKVFRKYLYDQWSESLSDEDKQCLTERKKKKERTGSSRVTEYTVCIQNDGCTVF